MFAFQACQQQIFSTANKLKMNRVITELVPFEMETFSAPHGCYVTHESLSQDSPRSISDDPNPSNPATHTQTHPELKTWQRRHTSSHNTRRRFCEFLSFHPCTGSVLHTDVPKERFAVSVESFTTLKII